MRKTKFQRVASFLLAALLLIGGSVAVGAEDMLTTSGGSSSVTDKTIADYKEELESILYSDYMRDFKSYQRATESVVIDAVNDLDESQTDVRWLTDEEWKAIAADSSQAANNKGLYVTEFDGQKALYTPGDGKVTFTKSGIKEGLYSIRIVYYPVEGKAASIEREFYINGSAPFKEARSLTLPKVWSNTYRTGEYKVPAKKSAEEYLSRAKAMGLTAVTETREDGTYLVIDMPIYWTSDISAFLIDELKVRFITTDKDRNELRPQAVQKPEWCVYDLRDSQGYYAESFECIISPDEKGNVSFTLKGVNEPVAVAQIILMPHEDLMTYDEYIKQYENEPAGTGSIKLEAEYNSSSSTDAVYPVEDRASAATSPSDTSRVVLNTIGGEKWQTSGQSVTYRFRVPTSGLYTIDMRYKQDVLDGLFTSRSITLKSEGLAEGDKGYYNGYPFLEASRVRFNYSGYWQSTSMHDGTKDADGNMKYYQFYFKEGVTYTITLEVTLGTMAEVVNKIESSLNSINNDYLSILRLTGTKPDDYRDYFFSRVMPGTLADMVKQSQVLETVADELKEIAGTSSSTVGTLVKVSKLLYKMHDEDEIARNMENLKTYIGSMGTFLTDAKTQPLQLDYILIQAPGSKLPTAEPNVFRKIAHEFSSFIQSFVRDYNSMGAMVETTEEALEVWVAYGRDQSQVIRNLITNEFTPSSNIAVDLKLVSAGTLMPSILAGMGPDVYLGIGQGDVINYAIRGALMTLDVDSAGNKRSDFETVTANFTDAAMLVLGIANADDEMHYYALPETQSFNMMFVRIDILANLGIEIPRTWEDIYMAQTILEGNNMEVGLTTDYKVFLYQGGGDLFADNGMRINLDSVEGLSAFETMCNLFTMYSFPYSYNAANRFRTGEMPILVADYTAMYNQLKVFATEIEGLWKFLPSPGTTDENGNINNCSISSVNADVMVHGCDKEEAAWEYLKWYTGASCQTSYANDMVAILGDSAKHNTANREALASMPWTTEEYVEVQRQFNNLAAVPNYPGSYYIDRYTNFAFLAAYNDSADPSSKLLSYINTINKEITRKRKEFKLETLEIGQTLADKRGAQALEALKVLAEQNDSLASSMEGDVRNAIADANIVVLRDCANRLLQTLSSANADSYTVRVSRQDQATKNGGYSIDSLNHDQLVYFAATCLNDAADALGTY